MSIETFMDFRPSGQLRGRVALVTGSGRNIGRAIALLAATEGAAVAVNGSADEAAVDAVVDEITAAGGRATGVMCDVSDPVAVAEMVARVEAELGPVDIAVNNVGRRKAKTFDELTVEDWRSVMSTNLDSVFYVTRCVVAGMKARGWGRIINISGYDGFTGHIDKRAANVTAKAGMHGLSKAIAREYSGFGITANTVAPGAIFTQREDADYAHIDVEAMLARIATHSVGHSDDIAAACLYLAAESGRFVTGQVIHVNGGEFMF